MLRILEALSYEFFAVSVVHEAKRRGNKLHQFRPAGDIKNSKRRRFSASQAWLSPSMFFHIREAHLANAYPVSSFHLKVRSCCHV